MKATAAGLRQAADEKSTERLFHAFISCISRNHNRNGPATGSSCCVLDVAATVCQLHSYRMLSEIIIKQFHIKSKRSYVL